MMMIYLLIMFYKGSPPSLNLASEELNIRYLMFFFFSSSVKITSGVFSYVRISKYFCVISLLA